ncbi:hypothetical protein CVT25_000654 [Psilocybe cyanescens]|uniref:Uncharacterized protein n=1 Tax=Psilocybe cyanescens TaxID=93625 RepID=A0A409X3P5_PSICY|nr:hypothetical protein CVT25_000654 [Psilocybe cyanescens]
MSPHTTLVSIPVIPSPPPHPSITSPRRYPILKLRQLQSTQHTPQHNHWRQHTIPVKNSSTNGPLKWTTPCACGRDLRVGEHGRGGEKKSVDDDEYRAVREGRRGSLMIVLLRGEGEAKRRGRKEKEKERSRDRGQRTTNGK